MRSNKPLNTYIIKVNGEKELPSAELKEKIGKFLDSQLSCLKTPKNRILVSFEAMPSQVHGGSSTISTFIALARSHAILDTYLFENDWDTYDYTGVYPISTHAYYKKLIEAPKDLKVTKELMRDYLVENYNITTKLSLDESDSIFLAKTLVEVKWNNDIDELIREQKRHRKTLKMAHAIAAVDEEIERLKQLLTK